MGRNDVQGTTLPGSRVRLEPATSPRAAWGREKVRPRCHEGGGNRCMMSYAEENNRRFPASSACPKKLEYLRGLSGAI